MFLKSAQHCERHVALTEYCLAPRISTYRILSTQIAELSFIPLVARDQSTLPCLSNHMLSSRILCGSKLSRTSSGNHCRSDPVQVQSTCMFRFFLCLNLCSNLLRCFSCNWRNQFIVRPGRCPNAVTPKGVQPPALCHASATREGP